MVAIEKHKFYKQNLLIIKYVTCNVQTTQLSLLNCYKSSSRLNDLAQRNLESVELVAQGTLDLLTENRIISIVAGARETKVSNSAELSWG